MATHTPSVGSLAALVLLGPAFVWLALEVGHDPLEHDAAHGLVERDADLRGSLTCRACHPDQHATWSETFHSTMTQAAGPASVLGRFDGAEVEFYGARATPFERDGRYFMRLPPSNSRPARVAEVKLTVGSRRYQQYFESAGESEGDRYRRLPLLWSLVDRRWMHLNGIFLNPDDPDWEAHAATWNENCIFCHNTGPEPRLDATPGAASKRFDSRVAELGIACEACHGPGDAHVAKHAGLVGRYAAHLDGQGDDTIVHPDALPQAQALAVCGQCHSQRLPEPLERLADFLDTGPSFRPGQLLADHVQPITRQTPPLEASRPDVFRDRFWGDGTARLTAYEYLGITQSPCVAGGEMTCGSCHVMHGGDVHGQIEPELRGDPACLQCHADIASDVATHTGHDAQSSGSSCLACHMPRIVYGILDVHRSHRIEVPDTKRDVEAGRPHACTLCHTDRSALWAADEMARLWGEGYERPGSRPDGAPLELSEALASLHAGDAVQRAVYARHLGRADSAVAPAQRAFAYAHLLMTLGDAYPSVRHLARRALVALDRESGLGLEGELDAWDHMQPPGARVADVRAFLERFARAAPDVFAAPDAGATRARELLFNSDYRIDESAIVELMNRQSTRVISIGE